MSRHTAQATETKQEDTLPSARSQRSVTGNDGGGDIGTGGTIHKALHSTVVAHKPKAPASRKPPTTASTRSKTLTATYGVKNPNPHHIASSEVLETLAQSVSQEDKLSKEAMRKVNIAGKTIVIMRKDAIAERKREAEALAAKKFDIAERAARELEASRSESARLRAGRRESDTIYDGRLDTAKSKADADREALLSRSIALNKSEEAEKRRLSGSRASSWARKSPREYSRTGGNTARSGFTGSLVEDGDNSGIDGVSGDLNISPRSTNRLAKHLTGVDGELHAN